MFTVARSLLPAVLVALFTTAVKADTPASHPNILWLTSEDHGPHLGCYGDKFASTPNVDRLAAKGVIYTRCWSNSPCCALARTRIISGLYASATGGEHMRSMVPYPRGKQMFPQFLREAGYYCSNNSKEDYNLAQPGKVWDESSKKAHWRNRKPGQPFFAVFNTLKSHESQIRLRPHKPVHDPARVRVPAYHPDTPEVRRDWAQYHDKVSEGDADAGTRLKELEQDGLADDTIVFYYSDHGPGMPRSKRWPYDSGLHVPLVVYIPQKWRKLAPKDYVVGGKCDRLVSFVDLAPTVLSLAGIRPPEWMHGQAFLGEHTAEPQSFLHGFRGRMDERYDLVRSVTDGRYVYIRNYLPHLKYGEHVEYMFEMPTTQVWKRLHDAGKLTAAQDRFWNTKAPEELYDLESDPDEVRSLVGSPRHLEILKKLRQAQQQQARKIRDVGFLPEVELLNRVPGVNPYDWSRDESNYPFERVFATAELASLRDPQAVSELKKRLNDEDPAVRYWACLGILMRSATAYESAAAEIGTAMRDRSFHVRIVAAELLVRHGKSEESKQALQTLVELANWEKSDVFVSLTALAALDAIEERTLPVAEAIRTLPETGKVSDPRYAPYVRRLLTHLKTKLK